MWCNQVDYTQFIGADVNNDEWCIKNVKIATNFMMQILNGETNLDKKKIVNTLVKLQNVYDKLFLRS